MRLSELMSGYTPSAVFRGEIMANDMVLAVAPTSETAVSNYYVVEEHIEGVESSINATTNDKEYIRSGRSTTKSSNQRTFSLSGDRFVGDEAQDFLMSKKYATGQDAVINYVYFDLKSGVGEKGQLTVSVDTDAGGNAGENSSISINLSKVGAAPQAFSWGSSASTYAVTLLTNGGTITAGHEVTEYTTGTAVTLPTSSYVTKEDYTFDGWYDIETLTEVTTIPADATGAKTYSAKWTT